MPTVRHQGRALTDAFITIDIITHTETYDKIAVICADIVNLVSSLVRRMQC